MNILSTLIPIFALAGLCAGWAGVQLLARKVGTKNHIDNSGSCGSGCTCMGGHCERED